jgi:hypothetical protein
MGTTPFRETTIALDFDRTFTSDIDMWRYLVWLFTQRGHKVYLVTGRHDTPENRKVVFETLGTTTALLLADFIFCDHQAKRAVAQAAGIMIDIWIDDLPELIGHADRDVFRKLEAQQPIAETLPVFEPGVVDFTSFWKPA